MNELLKSSQEELDCARKLLELGVDYNYLTAIHIKNGVNKALKQCIGNKGIIYPKVEDTYSLLSIVNDGKINIILNRSLSTVNSWSIKNNYKPKDIESKDVIMGIISLTNLISFIKDNN